MVKGLYTAYTGMKNEQRRLDVLSNNLANAATTGYKKEGVTSRAFSELYSIKINDASEPNITRPIGKMSLGVRIGESYRDWSEGSIKNTQNPYDLALTGKGFFTIQSTDKSGNEHIRYTRDGEFIRTMDGYLTTKDGDNVLDSEGNPVRIPDAKTVAFSADGRIECDGVVTGQIGITDFADYNYLQQYGENAYETVEGAEQIATNTSVEQGLLETSNVNVVQEMVTMITVERSYQTGQKIISSIDSMLDKAVNQVGRL